MDGWMTIEVKRYPDAFGRNRSRLPSQPSKEVILHPHISRSYKESTARRIQSSCCRGASKREESILEP